MSVPWQYGPKRFTLPANTYNLVQLNVPRRGVIRSIRVETPDASSGQLTFLNNREAAERMILAAEGSSESTNAGITPRSSIILEAGLEEGTYFNPALWLAYCNNDGEGPTSREGRLWLVISTGAGTTYDFVITMTIGGADF